jgi:formylglycine-generating enzyme required for sulfatase activity
MRNVADTFLLAVALLAGGVSAARAQSRTLTNAADGSVLVWIPGGEFTMGSADGDADEMPVSRLRVEGFWLGQKEVTNAQFARFLEAKGGRQPLLWDDPRFSQPDQPVAGVGWSSAVAYCTWAGLRLPTEAEWEYAAAGARQLRYGTATGQIDHDLANYDGTGRFSDLAAPVGSFPPNPFGLHDMAGNVFEWTSSLWLPYPYNAADGRETPETRGFRVMRGGCWHWGDFDCRVSTRHRHQSHLQYDYVGLRVAKTASESDAAALPAPPSTAAPPKSAPNEALLAALRRVYEELRKAGLTPAQRQAALELLNKLARTVKSQGTR